MLSVMSSYMINCHTKPKRVIRACPRLAKPPNGECSRRSGLDEAQHSHEQCREFLEMRSHILFIEWAKVIEKTAVLTDIFFLFYSVAPMICDDRCHTGLHSRTMWIQTAAKRGS